MPSRGRHKIGKAGARCRSGVAALGGVGAALALCLALASGCTTPAGRYCNAVPRQLTNCSPWYYVAERDVALHASYSGFDPERGERFSRLTIGDAALGMIARAERTILGAAFLFDVSTGDVEVGRDIVGELTRALLRKKAQIPSAEIVVTLDPINHLYGRHVGPAARSLVAGGADVFYSDLLSTRASRHWVLQIREVGGYVVRFVDTYITLGLVRRVSSLPLLPVRTQFVNGISLEMILRAIALKANHRKLLVVDGTGGWEALVSSANPHNDSVGSDNYAISLRGRPARYIYGVLREDVVRSLRTRRGLWHDKSRAYRERFLTEVLPPVEPEDLEPLPPDERRTVGVRFVTESRIRDEILTMLATAEPDDEVRIQMFYLSDLPTVAAVLHTATRMRTPLRIILDPSKDAFGRIKDGTPNRQVASWLMERADVSGSALELRWSRTHGEQNHAKIMSITNESTGRFDLITGSANWTGKNLSDINMEANVRLRGARRITGEFNAHFHRFWTNGDGMLYTMDYRGDDGKYAPHTGLEKWLRGERLGHVTW